MISNPPSYQQQGLTLLEMMVVLLIAGMAITLAFQSLGQWRRANASISSISGATQQTTLTESWLQGSLRSLIALEKTPFEGTAERLKGVEAQPVQLQQGSSTDVQWSIGEEDGVRQLLLEEGERHLALPLPGAASATFEYLDNDGRTHAQWPPKLGLHDQLPAAIVLRQKMDDGNERLWASAIIGARNPRYNPFEVDLDN